MDAQDRIAEAVAVEGNRVMAIRLKTSVPTVNVAFTLTGYGYGQRLRIPAPAKVAGIGSRVEYRQG